MRKIYAIEFGWPQDVIAGFHRRINICFKCRNIERDIQPSAAVPSESNNF